MQLRMKQDLLRVGSHVLRAIVRSLSVVVIKPIITTAYAAVRRSTHLYVSVHGCSNMHVVLRRAVSPKQIDNGCS